jgi:hypothetical protein
MRTWYALARRAAASTAMAHLQPCDAVPAGQLPYDMSGRAWIKTDEAPELSVIELQEHAL